MLLDHNANIHAVDSYGSNALQRAAKTDRENKKSINLLLARGINKVHKDSSGNTALHYAVQFGNLENIALLTDKDTIHIQNDNGETPLFAVLLARSNRPKTTNFLIGNGADPLHRNAKGKTVLDVAKSRSWCTISDTELIELLERHANQRKLVLLSYLLSRSPLPNQSGQAGASHRFAAAAPAIPAQAKVSAVPNAQKAEPILFDIGVD
jgi:ankyrin repeat protein